MSDLNWMGTMETGDVKLHFEQQGSQLTAVEIDHGKRSPLITRLHKALFTLGIVVAAYQVKPGANGFIERIMLTRSDGGAIQGNLSAITRAAILPIALNDDSDEITRGETAKGEGA